MPGKKASARSKRSTRTAARTARWSGLPKAKIMAIYNEHVRRFRTKTAKSVFISQNEFELGTNDEWSNATEIDRNPAWVDLDNANYVWSSREPNSEHAVISERFNLPTNRSIRRGRLRLAVDNYAIVLINGRIVTYDAPQADEDFFNPGRTFNVRSVLRRGRNDIVIIAFNFDGPRSSSNPAGVAARLNVRLSGS